MSLNNDVHCEPVLLALATSTECCAVALSVPAADETARIFALEASSESRGSGAILAMIEALLTQAGLHRHTIDVIAFDQGPGAFTGVRVGCSVAQGLGFALERPVLSLSSLEIVAAAALSPGSEAITLTPTSITLNPITRTPAIRNPLESSLIWSVLDARMGEVYCAAYRCGATFDLELHQEPTVCSPGAAVELITSVSTVWRSDGSLNLDGERWRWPNPGRLIAAGNGFSRFPCLLACAQQAAMEIDSQAWPSAEHLARAARDHWRAGRMISAAQIEPLYVRNKVALKMAEQRPRP
jgi:tRNA threonylcarbamoyladenosine biosynthesis protein TsaB